MSTRILDLQRRMRELGRLRAGHRVETKSGKLAPARLETWRLTSQSREHLESAALVYGGSVEAWNPGNGLPAQWELITDAARLRIIVPPGVTFSQAWELWSGGGCQRRCNGERELLSDQPCLCPADYDARREQAQGGKACKPTTRVNVMLPDVPDIGVWRLESHGFYAAVELAGAYDLIELATSQGRMIPAFLRLEQRVVKRPGKPRQDFVVPVIEIAHTTGQVLQTLGVLDDGAAPALSSPGRAALPAGEQPALAAPATRGGNGDGAAKQRKPPAPPLPSELAGAASPLTAGEGDAADETAGPAGTSVDTEDDTASGEASPPQQPDDEKVYRNVGHAAADAGLDDDGRHDLSRWASAGRVASSKELTVAEAQRAIRAATAIKTGRAEFVRDGEELLIVEPKTGFLHDVQRELNAERAPSLDETRAALKARLTALGDAGKAGWKAAGLPALSKLTVDLLPQALTVVDDLETRPF